jgi:acetylornithine/succinyldiaminopimelate/putrescine aminotransferase
VENPAVERFDVAAVLLEQIAGLAGLVIGPHDRLL